MHIHILYQIKDATLIADGKESIFLLWQAHQSRPCHINFDFTLYESIFNEEEKEVNLAIFILNNFSFIQKSNN